MRRTTSLFLVALGAAAVTHPASAYAWPLTQLDADGASQSTPKFPTPDSLEPAVGFWSNLFLRHGSDKVIIHDRENMELVWQVLDLPKSSHGQVDERAATHLTHDAMEHLRKRLKRLEIDPTPTDDEDRAIIAIAGGTAEPAALQGAWQRLRAQRGVADQFRAGLGRCQAWLTEIRQILREEGVPEEIAALPFVESMFNPKARSSVGAVGVWQLMPATARGLGLHVSRRGGDDRSNVLKATRAAARMLRKNYELLGSWPLAITAYNHGPNGVKRAVNLMGSTDLAYLIDNYQKATWGFASKNFYAEFLAALAAVNRDRSDVDVTVPASAAAPAVSGAVPQQL